MQGELCRLASFSSWSSAPNVSPLTLARCGFFYVGPSDAVECFECKTRLSGWSADDTLQEMHKQKTPHCPLVNGNTSTNVPLKMNLPALGGIGAGRGDIETDFANLDLNRSNIVNSDPMTKILFAAHKRANSKGVFCEIDRFKPDYEKLQKEEVQLRTFYDWPSVARTSPQVLAREGLFYTGTEDRVQCAFCRGSMRSWEPTDVPSAEYKKHFPNCPFVRGKNIGNVPIAREPDDASPKTNDAGLKAAVKADGQRQAILERLRLVEVQIGPRLIQERLRGENLIESTRAWPVRNDPPMFPDYANVSQRLSSFARGQVSCGQTAEGLANAGWFWIGPGDKVQCFQCGGNLRDWEPEDDPWEEHKRWYANCSYIKNNFPTPRRQFQEPVHQMSRHITGQYPVEPREGKARKDTATVCALLKQLDVVINALNSTRHLPDSEMTSKGSVDRNNVLEASECKEETIVTFQSPLQQPPSESPPGTNIDIVVMEDAFHSLELVSDQDSEATTLREGELGSTCCICLDHPPDCALCPCGHFACLQCIDQWKTTLHPAILTCHFCRQVVEEVLKF